RLQAVLQTLAGKLTVTDACARLGIGLRRFHLLRREALQAALERLEPRPAGRPERRQDADCGRVAALEAALRELRLDLRAAQVREEIALLLPHVLRPTRSEKRARRRARGPKPKETNDAPCGSADSYRHVAG